jgi:hypothetical protein
VGREEPEESAFAEFIEHDGLVDAKVVDEVHLLAPEALGLSLLGLGDFYGDCDDHRVGVEAGGAEVRDKGVGIFLIGCGGGKGVGEDEGDGVRADGFVHGRASSMSSSGLT